MSEQHYSQIPVKPLVAGMSTKIEPVEKVFFFERSDGKIICVKEQEAWSLWSRRTQVLGRSKRFDFKLIGVGDGIIFSNAIAEAKVAGRTDITKAQEIIRKGEQDELEACRGRIIQPRDMDKLA